MSNNPKGMYRKYNVERTDGREVGPCFILEYARDAHARRALAAYADSCQDENPLLAADLRNAVARYTP